MKYLTIDDIKQQLRLDFDCEDALLKNERNRILDSLQSMLVNIGFFAADDESEEKKDLVERIEAKWRKFVAVSEPTPIILESMRHEEKTLGDEVKAYLESLNE